MATGVEAMGAAMRRLRQAQGLTMRQVADACGCTSDVNLSRAETGQQWLPADTLFAVGAVLGYERRSDWLVALAEELRAMDRGDEK
nr:hypothetical protein [uncultured archaeon]